MEKKLTVAGGILWLAGLGASIAGLNIEGDAGTWMAVGGNIAFLLGLAIEGVVWAMKRKQAPAKEPAGEPEEKAGE